MAFSSHRAFTGLYRALAGVNIPPPMAKSMEVWECAAALGIGFVNEDEPAFAGADAGLTPNAQGGISRGELDILRQRVAAAQGLGEEPQPSVTNPSDVAAMISAFNTSRG